MGTDGVKMWGCDGWGWESGAGSGEAGWTGGLEERSVEVETGWTGGLEKRPGEVETGGLIKQGRGGGDFFFKKKESCSERTPTQCLLDLTGMK